jgi:hypothetical protein
VKESSEAIWGSNCSAGNKRVCQRVVTVSNSKTDHHPLLYALCQLFKILEVLLMLFNLTRKLRYSLYMTRRRLSGQLHYGVRLGATTRHSQFMRKKTLGFRLLFLLPSILFVANVRAQRDQNTIHVPVGLSLLLKAKGEGVQVYECVDGSWTLQAPAADLLDEQSRVIGRHYGGPTWRLNDGSLVEGAVVSKQVSPETTSIPWLLIKSVRGTGSLEAVQFIQRSETHGGIAPSGNCSQATAVRVPYTAMYTFYGRAMIHPQS